MGLSTLSVLHKWSPRAWRLGLLSVLLVVAAAVYAPADEAADLDASKRLYMVQLHGEPAARTFARQRGMVDGHTDVESASYRAAVVETRRQMATLSAMQDDLLVELSRRDISPTVVSRLTRVYHGLSLFLTPDEARQVETLPQVLAVHLVVPKRRTNSTSVPFLGVPGVWQSAGLTGAGVTGAGITVGVIDSGIDYLHVDFDGSGLEMDYAANDVTVISDGFFPSAKVVGGWDFVGDAYDAGSPDPSLRMPQPDPDPMDCNGHGTHVAGTAAGLGVEGGGTTYPGPYDATTPFGSLVIGPGVAPEALLYGLRVFGCDGETAVVEQALEWAVDPDGNGDFADHLDIVNLSLTSPQASASDPTAVAADMAALAGVVVVASAGNDGGSHFAAGSPGIAERAIAVAASWDPDTTFPARAVRLTSPPELAATHQAGGSNFGPALVEPGVSGEAVLADPLDACAPLLNSASSIDGKVAVVVRSEACSYVTQVRNAQQAGTTGAVGVVIVNDRPGLEGVFNDGTGGDITIPPLMMRRIAGQRLIDALPGRVDVTLTPTVLEDMFAIFSSRGPRVGDLLAKPDVAAPGVAITSARLGNASSGGRGSMILSGTSMASPHVAGHAALLRQQHPSWTPKQIKTRLMNTARDVFFDPELTPPRVGPPQMGAGRIDPPAAVLDGGRFLASGPGNDSAGVSVSWGALEVAGTSVHERLVRLENGPRAVVYDLSVEVLSAVPGASVDFVVPRAALVAGDSVEIPVRLSLDAAALRHVHDPSLEEATVGFERHWMSELAGYLVATPQDPGAATLRLPFYAAPRPVAAMQAASSSLQLPSGTTGSVDLLLQGQGLDQGEDTPVDIVSLVSAYELTASNLEVDGSPFPGVAQMGIHNDVASQGLDEATLAFGLQATAGPSGSAWSTPSEVLVSILIDVDDDGLADFELQNSDTGSASFGFLTDAFVSLLVDLEGGGTEIGPPLNFLSPQDRQSALFANDSMALAIPAASLGLSDGNSRFEYAVEVTRRLGGGSLAQQKALLGAGVPMPEVVRTYDAAAAALSFSHASGAPIFSDLAGEILSVDFDLDAWVDHATLGLLLLHHHGGAVQSGAGQRGEVVTLRADAADLALQGEAAAVVGPREPYLTRWRVKNQGSQEATAAFLEVTLPAGLDFEPSGSDVACSAMGSDVVCDLTTMAVGEQQLVEVNTLVVGQDLPGNVLSVQGRLSTASFDSVPLNDHRALQVLVSEVVLGLDKELTGGDLLPGGSVFYRLTLTNQGPFGLNDLAGPELLDVLPPQLELVAAAASVGMVELDLAARQVTWNGSLSAEGDPLVIDIEATVLSSAADARVENQAVAFFDSQTDGTHDGEVVSDDPSLPGLVDGTVFVVGGVFQDGFESGNTSRWSATEGALAVVHPGGDQQPGR